MFLKKIAISSRLFTNLVYNFVNKSKKDLYSKYLEIQLCWESIETRLNHK